MASDQSGEYSTILVEKKLIKKLSKARIGLLHKGIDNIDPDLRKIIKENIDEKKLEAYSRGTVVAIALLALTCFIDKKGENL